MFLSNKISRAFGKIARFKFPKFIQTFINEAYIKIFKINLNEFDKASSYESLNKLFTRKIIIPRKMNITPFNIISPSDSLITECGKIEEEMALQIKGMKYRVIDLIGEKKFELENFSFINLYLSPRDYHRFHAPCDLEVLESRYFNGTLLPVNKSSLIKNKNLFLQNERVVLKVKFKFNNEIAYYVAVGALNVGSIVINFENRISTNNLLPDQIYTYNTPISLKAGDEIGRFEMGSTIVLILKSVLKIKTNDVVKMGDEIGIL